MPEYQASTATPPGPTGTPTRLAMPPGPRSKVRATFKGFEGRWASYVLVAAILIVVAVDIFQIAWRRHR